MSTKFDRASFSRAAAEMLTNGHDEYDEVVAYDPSDNSFRYTCRSCLTPNEIVVMNGDTGYCKENMTYTDWIDFFQKEYPGWDDIVTTIKESL